MRRSAVAIAIALAGCSADESPNPLFDPQAPGASGQVTLAEGVTTTGYSLVAIRMTPLGNDQERTLETIVPMTWPTEYFIGGGIGASQVSDWSLRVWLAVASNESAPAAGAPHAEAMIDTGCMANGSCQVAHVDLVLAP